MSTKDLIARRLEYLNDELESLNVPFLYKEVPSFSDCTEVISGWAKTLEATSVMANIHYEVNERELDAQVSEAL